MWTHISVTILITYHKFLFKINKIDSKIWIMGNNSSFSYIVYNFINIFIFAREILFECTKPPTLTLKFILWFRTNLSLLERLSLSRNFRLKLTRASMIIPKFALMEVIKISRTIFEFFKRSKYSFTFRRVIVWQPMAYP